MVAGAMFQKPSVRLLTKPAACSRLSARTCASGTRMQVRQPAQNLFLKCSLPGMKWGEHAPLLNGAPQQAEQHSGKPAPGMLPASSPICSRALRPDGAGPPDSMSFICGSYR